MSKLRNNVSETREWKRQLKPNIRLGEPCSVDYDEKGRRTLTVIQKHNHGAQLWDDLSLWTLPFHERTPASRLRTRWLIVSFLLDWKTNLKISEEWPLWEAIRYDRHVAAHAGVGPLVTLILQRKLWRGRKIIKKYCMINKSPKYQTDVITRAW